MAARNKDERSEAQKEQDRKEIVKLYIQEGKTQAEVAAALDISQSTVSRDLKVLTKRFRASSARQMKQVLSEKLLELQMIKTEAWEAWSRSKKVAVTAKEILIRKESDLPGDPRFLKQLHETVGLEIKTLGLGEDGTIKLSPETILLLSALGLDTSEVAATFEQMIQQAAKNQPVKNTNRS